MRFTRAARPVSGKILQMGIKILQLLYIIRNAELHGFPDGIRANGPLHDPAVFDSLYGNCSREAKINRVISHFPELALNGLRQKSKRLGSYDRILLFITHPVFRVIVSEVVDQSITDGLPALFIRMNVLLVESNLVLIIDEYFAILEQSNILFPYE